MTMRLSSGAAVALALMHAGCDGSRVFDHTPAAPEPLAVEGFAGTLAVPHAVFRTTPRDVDGRIAGGRPLEVLFNMCPSRPADFDDELKFTYDFDADGTVDQIGHCRAGHTFTEPASARVCVSDRRPDGIVCRTYRIEPAGEAEPAPEHVMTLVLNSCPTDFRRAQWIEATITPPIPAGHPYSLSLSIDGEMGATPFRWTFASLVDYECTGFLGYVYDDSPMPNDHLLEMPPSSCAHQGVFLLSVIEGIGPVLAETLQSTVSDFQVPGRRARIEGPTSFTCP